MTELLVVLDVDSTLIQDEVIDLLAVAAGTGDQVAAITARAMAGELDFAASLTERVATLAGLPESAIQSTAARVRPSAGATELIAHVHAMGGAVGAVSGGFTQVLDAIAPGLRLDVTRANRLEVSGGTLTGRVQGAIVDAAAKRTALLEWATRFGVPRHRTIAIGDGANDLLMMAEAGLSIAYCAKPRVRATADVCVSVPDLSQIIAVIPSVNAPSPGHHRPE